MRFQSFAALFLAAVASAAPSPEPEAQQDGGVTTTPNQGPLPYAYPFKCADWCGPIVTVSQNECNSHGYDCFCNQPHMKHLIPLCEACSYNARNIGNGIEFYPAMKNLINSCDFKTTSVTKGFAAPTSAPVMAAGGLAAMLALAAI